MKITKEALKRLIKEEMSNMIAETSGPQPDMSGGGFKSLPASMQHSRVRGPKIDKTMPKTKEIAIGGVEKMVNNILGSMEKHALGAGLPPEAVKKAIAELRAVVEADVRKHFSDKLELR